MTSSGITERPTVDNKTTATIKLSRADVVANTMQPKGPSTADAEQPVVSPSGAPPAAAPPPQWPVPPAPGIPASGAVRPPPGPAAPPAALPPAPPAAPPAALPPAPPAAPPAALPTAPPPAKPAARPPAKPKPEPDVEVTLPPWAKEFPLSDGETIVDCKVVPGGGAAGALILGLITVILIPAAVVVTDKLKSVGVPLAAFTALGLILWGILAMVLSGGKKKVFVMTSERALLVSPKDVVDLG